MLEFSKEVEKFMKNNGVVDPHSCASLIKDIESLTNVLRSINQPYSILSKFDTRNLQLWNKIKHGINNEPVYYEGLKSLSLIRFYNTRREHYTALAREHSEAGGISITQVLHRRNYLEKVVRETLVAASNLLKIEYRTGKCLPEEENQATDAIEKVRVMLETDNQPSAFSSQTNTAAPALEVARMRDEFMLPLKNPSLIALQTDYWKDARKTYESIKNISPSKLTPHDIRYLDQYPKRLEAFKASQHNYEQGKQALAHYRSLQGVSNDKIAAAMKNAFDDRLNKGLLKGRDNQFYVRSRGIATVVQPSNRIGSAIKWLFEGTNSNFIQVTNFHNQHLMPMTNDVRRSLQEADIRNPKNASPIFSTTKDPNFNSLSNWEKIIHSLGVATQSTLNLLRAK